METIFRNVSIVSIGLMTFAATTPDLGQNTRVAKNLVVFHAITSANGHFKTGEIMDIGAEGIDVYNTNTTLNTFESEKFQEPAERDRTAIDQILA